MEKYRDISEQEAEEDVFRDMRETYRIAIKKKMNNLMEKDDFDQLKALKYVISTSKFILDKYDTASVGSENSEDDIDDDGD